jgi:serine/threonine protein kinase
MTSVRRRRSPSLLLPLNVDQINEEATLASHHRHHCSLLNDTEDSLFVLSQQPYININDATNTTFRQEGVTIGSDYLRVEGCTVTRGELHPSSLTLLEIIGRGAFSTVQRAIWNRKTTIRNDDISISATTTTKGQESSSSNAVSLLSSSSSSEPDKENLAHHNQDQLLGQAPSSDQEEVAVVVVAVKQCYSLVFSSKPRRDMFVKELQALGRIMRDEEIAPNLLMLYGAFLEQDMVTMVLECMDRGSLEQLIHYRNQRKHPNDRLPSSPPQLPNSSLLLMQEEDVVAAMAYQMVSGLAFLNARHMLHRDLKPANVLLHSSGHVKLADFGISTFGNSSNATPSMTTMMIMSTCLANTVVGTAYYMSPERLRAKPYGRSSDVWSLGCVLMELCVGHTPWQPPTRPLPQHGDVVFTMSTSSSIHSLVELVMTMEETPVEELVPHILKRGTSTNGDNNNSNDDSQSNDSSVNEGSSSTERLREILLGCLQLQPGTLPRSVITSHTITYSYVRINCFSDFNRKTHARENIASIAMVWSTSRDSPSPGCYRQSS